MDLLATIWWWLYFIIAFSVVCVGVFGLAATKSERMAESRAMAEALWTSPQNQASAIPDQYNQATRRLIYRVLAVALYWPFGIPLYLAWKKGSFIDQALQKREELQHDEHRAG